MKWDGMSECVAHWNYARPSSLQQQQKKKYVVPEPVPKTTQKRCWTEAGKFIDQQQPVYTLEFQKEKDEKEDSLRYDGKYIQSTLSYLLSTSSSSSVLHCTYTTCHKKTECWRLVVCLHSPTIVVILVVIVVLLAQNIFCALADDDDVPLFHCPSSISS